jgi:putative acyl-CoA dehydrogenase
MCLDVLRAISRERDACEAVLGELSRVKGWHPDYDQALDDVIGARRAGQVGVARARWFTEQMAKFIQASLMHRNAPAAIAACFAQTRLGHGGGQVYGALPEDAPVDEILKRAGAELLVG